MSSQGKKVVKDSLILTIAHTIAKFRGILFLPVVIAAVGLKNYGAFVQILINARMIAPICTLALPMGFLRYSSQYEDHEIERLSRDYWTIFWASLSLGLLGAFVIYITSPILNEKILEGRYLAAVRLSAIFVVNNAIMTQNSAYLRARRKFALFSFYHLLYTFLPYAGFVCAVSLTRSIFSGLAYYLLIQSLVTGFVSVRIMNALQFCRPSLTIFRKFLSYSWPLTFSQIAGGLLSKIDRYFIGYFLGLEALGLYNIVYSVSGILESVSAPFMNYFLVYMPKLWDAGKIAEVKQQLKKGLVYYLALCFGLLIALTLTLRPLLSVFLAQDLSAFEHFELLVCMIGLGLIAFGVSRFFFQVIRYQEKAAYILLVQASSAAFNILLNIGLIPSFGLIGASAATLLSYVGGLLLVNGVFSIEPDRQFIGNISTMLCLCMLIIGLLTAMNLSDSLQIFIAAGVGCLSYAVCVLLLKVIRIQELKQLLS